MKRDLRLAALLICVVCICVVMLTAWQIAVARLITLKNVETSTVNLASALSNYTDGIFKQSELILIGLTERVEKDGTGPEQLERLRSVIGRQMGSLPQIGGVFLYNAEGVCTFSTNQAAQGLSSQDREFFKRHVADSSRAPFVGPTIQSRVNGDWVISISRRVHHANDTFAGVMVVTISLEHLLKFYSGMQVGQTGVIGLLSASGHLHVRYPHHPEDVGRDLSHSPIFFGSRSSPTGRTEFTSLLDGVRRVYAFKHSDAFALVTVVGVGQDEAMHAWRDQTRQSLLVVLVLLGLLVGLGMRLISHIHNRIRVEDQLRISQTSLIELNRKLELIAAEDKLTGLANRRRFDEYLEDEFKRARRSRNALSLILIDVDYFKLYNDRYGHLAGDDCLVTISGLIQRCIRRPGEMVARYGGEEVAVVLPGCDEASARQTAETILRTVHGARIAHLACPLMMVTVSVGVATFTGDDERLGPKALIDLADRALYAAKSGGRNQVRVASETESGANQTWTRGNASCGVAAGERAEAVTGERN